MIIYKGKSELTHQHPTVPNLNVFSILQPIQLLLRKSVKFAGDPSCRASETTRPLCGRRESWLVSEPGELSLRKFLENTSGRERAHEAEAVLLETGWVSNLFPSFWSPHWCCEKVVINTSGRKQQESGTWNAIIVPLHVQFKTQCSS